MESQGSAVVGSAVEIRPGVFRPDWSAVTSAAAREALQGRVTARGGLLEQWSHPLGADEDLIWRTILRLYGKLGHPPATSLIAAETGIAVDRAQALLDKLGKRDLIDLDQARERIHVAYPFTESATVHGVELNGRAFLAACAVDALGVAEMYGTDTTISSQCHYCGSSIHPHKHDGKGSCAAQRLSGKHDHLVRLCL